MKLNDEDVTFEFEILIDESFSQLCTDSSINQTKNKNVLSLINDFENGKWRQDKFNNFVWDNIAETALSFRERSCLINKSHSMLVQAAKKLRLTDKEKNEKGQGSELAEIVLYGIMKHHYKALPVVPKIFYKQNAQDNAKGMDSVHIILDEKGSDFTLWFGEAKFYNSIQDFRLDAIVSSVSDSLQIDKLKKENSIITSASDLDHLILNETLKSNIKEALFYKKSIDELKHKLHIPILLLHECSITESQDSLTNEYRERIKKYHKNRAQAYFKKQIRKCSSVHQYADIRFYIILFPVPRKETIIQQFIKNIEHYQAQ
jgi:hypothetical protein